MTGRYLLYCFLLLYIQAVYAQNLVRNPGFEDVTNCNLTDEGITATYWNFPSLEGSSNNYHACSIDDNYSIPENISGFQQPLSGKGYGGLYLFSSVNISPITYREYLQGECIKDLEAGKVYQFTCFVSLAEPNAFPTDRLGVYFSKEKVSVTDYGVLPFTPHILHPGVFLKDTQNWVKYEGTFTATGGEKYLLMAIFLPMKIRLSCMIPALVFRLITI